MNIEYPPRWNELVAQHHAEMRAGNFSFFNPDDPQSQTKTLGVVFKVPDQTATLIAQKVYDAVPDDLRPKIVFQPAAGLHFTLQWSPEEYLASTDNKDLAAKLKAQLKDLPPLTGELVLPFAGKGGIWGMLSTPTNQEMIDVRHAVHQVWQSLNLPTGLKPTDYDLPYISTTRYREAFTDEEVERLLAIQAEPMGQVTLSEIWLVANDKFMSPEKTTIFDKIELH